MKKSLIMLLLSSMLLCSCSKSQTNTAAKQHAQQTSTENIQTNDKMSKLESQTVSEEETKISIAANSAMQSIKSFDFNKLYSITNNTNRIPDLEYYLQSEPLASLFKQKSAEIKFTINSISINKNNATAKIEVEHLDSEDFIGNFNAKSVQILANSNITEDETKLLLNDALATALNEATYKKVKDTYNLEFIKINNEWKLAELSDEVINLLTLNYDDYLWKFSTQSKDEIPSN